MGIAEHRHPVRAHHPCAFKTVFQIDRGLVRQAIHQIEIERGHPARPQPLDAAADHRGGLLAADGFLAMGREGLHAHACPRDPDLAHHAAPFLGQAARIELDRPFGRHQREMGVQAIHQRQQLARQDRIGTAPAKCDPPHPRALRQQAGDRGDFLMQRGEIGLHPRALPRSAGVAAAIIADLRAERDVEVERDIPARPGNRAFDGPFFQRAEIGSGGIAGVARHRLGEEVWVIGPHEAFKASPVSPVFARDQIRRFSRSGR